LKKDGKIFYGWWIIVALFLLMSVVYSPTINMVSLYTKSVSESLNVGRSEFMLYYTIMAFASMFSNMVVGRFIRKYNIKTIMVVGVILVAGSLIGFSFSTKLIHFYILAVFEGMGLAATCMIPPSVIITNWFNEKRGLCMGLGMSGTAFGGIVLSPITVSFITNFGWNKAYLFTAIIMLAVALPLILFIIKLSPSEMGLLPLGNKNAITSKIVGVTQKEAISSLSFWALCAGIVVTGIIINGVLTSMSPLLTDMGYTAQSAATLLSISFATVTLGKITIGRTYDKIGVNKTLLLISICTFLSLISLKLATVFAFGILYTILTGIAGTNISVTPSFLTGALYGNKEYSSIFGVVALFSSLGAALAPIVAGAIYNINQSYSSLLYVYMVLAFIAYVLFAIAVKKKPSFDVNHENLEKQNTATDKLKTA